MEEFETDLSKFSESDFEEIIECINRNIFTLGFIDIYLRIRKHIKSFLFIASIVMLYLILFQGYPIYFFFLPLIPILVALVIYFIDANIVVVSLNKAHNELLKKGIVITWSEVVEVTFRLFNKKAKA